MKPDRRGILFRPLSQNHHIARHAPPSDDTLRDDCLRQQRRHRTFSNGALNNEKLINRVEDVLNEQLQGLAKAHPQLTLHQDPLYVTRTDAPVAGKVALLSGGGSGHEPMHCGYIGQGMLSGACPGEIFTSPTPDKMFECAMQIDGGEGVLLIIKNYTGDILNFETATELLHESGIKVTTVVVDDDVAVKDSLYTAGRRGVANTVLIEKLVGAAASAATRWKPALNWAAA